MTVDNNLYLYQRSEYLIWEDDHIAGNMLAFHLDPNSDAASRNSRAIVKTVEWIIEETAANDRILDIGCGPGLYASQLTEHGSRVVGLDISSHSIAHARQRAAELNQPIKYRHMNYLNDPIEGIFDVAICICCDFGALIPDEQAVLLSKIADVLTDDGLFIFDVFTPGFSKSKTEMRDWCYVNGSDFWSSKSHFLLEEVKHFKDHHVWGNRYLVLDQSGKVKEFIVWDHYYTEKQISRLLLNNGFEVLTIKSDLIQQNDFISEEVMFVKAKKK